MAIKIESPYLSSSAQWLRGNLHTHTTMSDGPFDPQMTIDLYAAHGYGFLMFSDHDKLVDPTAFDSRGMVMVPGEEVTQYGPHILHVGASVHIPPDRDRQGILDQITASGGFAVMAHPNWEEHFHHCSQDKLEAFLGYAGIEIYNGVCRWAEGNPLATDRWDLLLGKGRRVWGFAHDDCHLPTDPGIAWNVVQVTERTPAGVVDALRNGRFYASTGVWIENISLFGSTIRVETRNADRIVAVHDFGRRAATADSPTMVFTVPEREKMSYIRFECYGRGENMAWTQPFFISREADA